jgi:subtilisin family serine protease
MAGLVLCIGMFCVLNGVCAAEAAAPEAPGSPEHQVLVMLHMAPPHYRPDASYGGRYGDDAGHSARRRIAQELARAYGLTLVNDWPMPALGIDCYVMEGAAGDSSAHLVEILSRDRRTEWVQPMNLFHTLGNNDPLYVVQPSAKSWRLNDLHRVATGRNVLVAVIDSGVEDGHPDLLGQVVNKQNFVDGSSYVAEQHGTAVAGIIAALAGNGVGIEGVAPDARLMALRACWQEVGQSANCNSFTLGKALNFAITHAAQVINLSLAGPTDRLLQRLVEVALQNGIKVVAAIDPHSASGGFPASVPGVLAVADQESGLSKRGVLLAPGHDIPTTVPGARWGFVSGSSYAAAHVSGMVALLTELRPSLTPAQIRGQIVAAESGSGGVEPAGVIDACATIGRIAGNCTCLCALAHASKSINFP